MTQAIRFQLVDEPHRHSVILVLLAACAPLAVQHAQMVAMASAGVWGEGLLVTLT